MTAQNADVPPSDSESPPPRPPGAQSSPPPPVGFAPPAQPPRQVPPGPRPATGSAAVPAPPAPAVSPGAPEPAAAEQPRRRSAGVLLATTVAVLALAVAVAAVLVAWRALERAGDARDIASAAGTAAAPSPPPGATTGPAPANPTDAGPTATPADPDSSPKEPVLNEQTRYEVAYADEPLTIEATSCQDMNVDLDAPQLRVSSEEFEINFNAACYAQPAHLTFAENVRASRVEGAPALTPIDCGKRVQTGVLGSNAQVPVRQGTVLCVLTSLAAATQSGIRQKMVIVEVTGVGKDGTVTAEVSAWHIPR